MTKIPNTSEKYFLRNAARHTPEFYAAVNMSRIKCCTQCQKEGPLSKFGKKRRLPDGFNYRCKKCESANSMKRHYANPEKAAIKDRAQSLRRNFGISVADYNVWMELQEGCCAICGAEEADSRGRRLHVDHCHSTGAVRGLLCGACNMGLGQFGDNAHRLASALDYLMQPAGHGRLAER